MKYYITIIVPSGTALTTTLDADNSAEALKQARKNIKELSVVVIGEDGFEAELSCKGTILICNNFPDDSMIN